MKVIRGWGEEEEGVCQVMDWCCHGVASLRTRPMTDVILIEAGMHCVCYCGAAL